MNAEDTYFFDLNGYLVVPEVLDADLLRRLNAQLDAHASTMPPDSLRVKCSQVLRLKGAMLELIDHPRIRPYLEALMGPPPYTKADVGPTYRLDHTYSVMIRPGATDVGTYILHCGGTPLDPSAWYQVRENRIYNSLVSVCFNLTDVGPADGGFGCLPGSHKANFRLPDRWNDLRGLNPLARPVCGPVGSALIFTETLTHGTLPWRGAHERRTVFYKYSAYSSAHSPDYLDEQTQDWQELDERQRAVLAGPHNRNGRSRRHLLTPRPTA